MKPIPFVMPDVFVGEPCVYRDDRGFFFESFNGKAFDEIIGKHVTFVQDKHSCSSKMCYEVCTIKSGNHKEN